MWLGSQCEEAYKLGCSLPFLLTPLSAIHTYPHPHPYFAMAHPARGLENATLPRSAITRTQLHDGDSISRYRTCEATRIFATFVNATDEELEDSRSYLSFPRTESSDIFGDSDSEFSYNTRATTPSESPVVRIFCLLPTSPAPSNDHDHFIETVRCGQGLPPSIS